MVYGAFGDVRIIARGVAAILDSPIHESECQTKVRHKEHAMLDLD